MKLIVVVLIFIDCLDMITVSKLVQNSLNDNKIEFEDQDSTPLNDDLSSKSSGSWGTRGIEDFVSPGYPVTVLGTPAFPVSAYPNNYYPYHYNQAQWPPVVNPNSYHWNQNVIDYLNQVNYDRRVRYKSPKITQKITTEVSDDEQKTKHKVVTSNDHPGTAYVTIKKTRSNTNNDSLSSKGRTIYHPR